MSIRTVIKRTQLLLEQGLYESRRALKTDDEGLRAPDIRQLEQRILLSASPAVVVAEAANAASGTAALDTFALTDQQFLDVVADSVLPQPAAEIDSVSVKAAPLIEGDTAPKTLELVFIDSNVSNIEQMIADLQSENQLDDSRTLEVVVLDSQQDGIAQITSTLLQYNGVDGVHIVSHGNAGQVQLGSTTLSLDNLDTYRAAISAWQFSLSQEADLLFYGCSLAATAEGQELIAELAAACDCDVAASDDNTGHAALGGDWDLEFTVGQIEIGSAFSQVLQQQWGDLLNVTIDNTSTGTSSGGNVTVSHTTSGANRLMLVGISINEVSDESVVSVSYNGDALSYVGSAENGDARVEIWSLVNPDAVTANVDVVFSGTTDGNTVGVVTFNGVDQITALGTFSSGTGGSGGGGGVTVASAADELAFAVISVDDATDYDLTPGGGQTELWDLAGGPNVNGGGSTVAGASFVPLSWTWSGSDAWAIVGVSIKPVAPVTTVTVDTTADYNSGHANYGDTSSIAALIADSGADGLISLREAIDAANNQPEFDTITFDITGAGPHTINLASALPTITDTVFIDGWSEPNWSSSPVVRIDGNGAGGNGLTFADGSDGSTVRGLMITRFGGSGVYINSGADGVTLHGNWIGTTGTGSTGVGNSDDGIDTRAASTYIGGTGLNEGNVITNSGDEGINLQGSGVTAHQILGNIIGLDPDGSTGSGNSDVGIAIISGTGNTIGGTTAAARNIISMNFEGIEINTSNNTVQGNYIGTDGTGTLGRGNHSSDGVQINSGTGNLIGGTTAGAGNVISDNAVDGIRINTGSSGTTVQGNLIGTNAAGTNAIGNVDDGVSIMSGSTGNTIGGTTAAARNVLSGNGATGIYIEGSDNVIQGNYIGTDITGKFNFGNTTVQTGEGSIRVLNATNNTIGGSNPGEGNLIAFGAGDGVLVQGTSSGTAILGNAIHSHAGLAIDLNDDGVTTNDAGDGDTGTNNLQNFPVLTSAQMTSATQVNIVGSLNSAANSYFRIDFFASKAGDGTGYGEGTRYLGSADVPTDGSGNAVINATVTAMVTDDEFISATATKSNATYSTFTDTSEFAQNIAVTNTAPNAADDAYSTGVNTPLAVGPETAGLANWWRLDDGGSNQTAVDSGTLANDATLGATTGIDTDDPAWTTGYVGSGALTFDGTTDYVATSSTVLKTASSFTMSTWFRTTKTTGQQHILWQGYGTGEGYGSAPGTTAESEMGLTIGNYDQPNKIVFHMGYEVAANGADPIHIISTSDFTDTTRFHNVVVTVTDLGGGIFSASLYVDGVLEGTDTGVQNDRSAWGALQIGKPGANQRYFSGEIDDVRIYDTTLSAGQIQNIAQAGVLQNDSDFDSQAIQVNTSVVTGPANGTLNINADGSFTYTPDADFTGTDTFTYRASDGSLDSNVATVTITVNDAPTLGNGTLASVAEDTADPAGQTVSTIFAGQFADTGTGAAFSGIAVVGNTASAGTQGTWQYSSNGGSNWYAIGTVADDTTALAVSSSTLIRFVPAANYHGTPPALVVRGMDNSYTGSFSTTAGSETRVNIDTATNGGTSAIAAATANLATSITSVNDAPTLTTFAATVDTINEDTEVELTFAELAAQGNEADIDGTVDAFVVTSITSGTLKIGTSAGAATAWAAGTNDTIDATNRAYWTATNNANGTLNAFQVIAQDNDSAESASPVTVQVSVSPVNDAPIADLNGSDGGGINFTTAFAEKDPAVAVTDTDATIADVDNSAYNSLTLTLAGFTDGNKEHIDIAGRRFDNTVSATHVETVGSTNFSLSFNGSQFVVTNNGGGTMPQADLQTLLRTITYENRDKNPTPGVRTIIFVVQDANGLDSATATTTINGTDVNDVPTLSTFAAPVDSTNEDTEVELTFAELTAQGNEADVDGTVDAFIVTSITSGTLRVGTSAGTATAWAASTNDTIDATNKAYWTPANNVNGTQNAFQVVAQDDDGATSASNVTVQVSVTDANDIPTLTTFAAPIDTTGEDTEVELTFAELAAQGDEADVDGTVDAFVVTSITSGTLKIGTSAGTATVWSAGTNNTIDAANKAYWTPATNANGTQNAFQVVAQDDDGATSASNVAVQVSVTPVNDAPVADLNGSDGGGVNYSTTFTELDPPVNITDSDATISDVDHTTYQSLTITLSGLFDGSNEKISVEATQFSFGVSKTAVVTVGTTDLAVTFDGAEFVITRDGGGAIPEADLQLMLRGITYEHKGNNPSAGNRTFTIVPTDFSGQDATPSVATVNVGGINTAPTLTTFAAPVETTNEDTEVEITFAELALQGDEADVDGTVTGFVVKSVPTGTLKIGTSAGTATSYAAGTNDVIDGTNQAYWTPASNSNGTLNALSVVAIDNGGLESSGNVTVQVSVTDVNDIPTLTNFAAPVDTTSEDTEVELTFAELAAQGNEADIDGTVDAFVVTSITSGTLKIGTSAGTATSYAAGTNDTINATNKAYWTPANDLNGTQNAFQVVAQDNDGATSAGNVTVQVSVTDVNDIPTLTTFAASVDTTNEDTEVELTFAELAAQGNEADIDGTVDAFVVTSITSGTLKIGTSAGTATAWAASTNDTINATNKAYWTPANNANGTQNAFQVVAQDDDGATSASNVTVQVSVADVNDIPTLTTFAASVDTTSEDTEVELTFAELAAQGNEADVDGTVDAFVVNSITSGTLKIGTSAGTATAWAAGTNDTIDATNKAYWTPANNVNGTQNAFQVVAQDDDGATSAGNVTVQVSVTDVNDIPTLTTFAAPVDTTSEDTEVELTFAELAAQGNEADADGTVDAFVVTSITSGTLRIGTSAGTATAWAASTNDTIDATNKAYWTPANNVNGTQNAFQVVAQDDDGAASASNVTVQVSVTPVNDAPITSITAESPGFTEGDSAVSLFRDAAVDAVEVGDAITSVVISVDGLVDGADEKLVVDGIDINLTDGNVQTTYVNGYNVDVDVTGTLATVTISRGVPIAVSDSETLLNSLAYNNTSQAIQNGTRTVTFESITDNGGGSATSVNGTSSVVTVNGQNDAPTLTGFAAAVDTTNEGVEAQITFAELAAEGDETDIDGTVDAFEVRNVASGTLRIGTSAGTATAWAAGTNDTIDATHQAYWTPADDAHGTLDALAVVAIDNDGAESSGNVIVQVIVAPVNDQPHAADDRPGIAFDGIDDFISVGPDAALEMTSAVTLEAWVNPNVSATTWHMIINREGEYEVALAPDGTVYWAFGGTDPSWGWHDTGTSVVFGEWSHVAVTYDNGDVTTYVNGVQVDFYDGSGVINDAHVALDDFRIGGRSNNPAGQYFDGRIADVRVWDIARTGTAVAADMNALLTGNEAGLVGYWRLDENSGPIATDRSGANDGTLTNGAAWSGHRIDEDAILNVTSPGVLANDFDVDGDILTVAEVEGNALNVGQQIILTSGAALTLNADGSFTYDTNAAFDYLGPGSTVTDSFSYTVTDGTLTDTAAVTIQIDGNNDAPTISAIANLTTPEDTATGPTAFTIGDADSAVGSLIVTASSSDQTLIPNGNITLSGSGANRTIDIQPAANQVGGPVTVTVTVDDGTTTSSETFTVTVTAVNDSPTGSVTIDNTTPAQGDTLTAANTLADADGLGPITYQWQRDGLNISGATGTIYTTVQADVDKTITVLALYTDGHGTRESVTSAATAAVTNVNDAPSGVPTITGTATEDQILTANTSGITDADGLGTFSYQWLRNGLNINAATAHNYLLGDADVGQLISVQVTWTDSYGTAEGPLTSAQTAPVTNVNDAPVITTISDRIIAEDTTTGPLTFTVSDVETAAGALTVTASSSNLAVVPNSNLTLVDLGSGNWTLETLPAANQHGGPVTITATVNDGTTTTSETFDVTVTPANDLPVGLPVIIGTPAEDQTLTADTSGISDVDGTGPFSHQWLRNGTPIVGATSPTYTLSDADVGAQISVQVRYTDGQATAEGPLTSATTAVVANVNDTPVGSPNINGTAQQYQTLTVDTTGIHDNDGLGTFNYQWLRDGVAIVGATSDTYTLAQNDVSAGISVQVSWTDANGTQEGPVVSSQTTPVANVNDAPLAVGESFSGNQLQNLTVAAGVLTANDIDPDGDGLTVMLATGPEHGQLTLNADGSFTYAPTGAFSGQDSFTYLVSDGTLFSNIVTVSLDLATTVAGSGDTDAGHSTDAGDHSGDTGSSTDSAASGSSGTGTGNNSHPANAAAGNTAAGAAAASRHGAANTGQANAGAPAVQHQSVDLLAATNSDLFISVNLEDVPDSSVQDDALRSDRAMAQQSGVHRSPLSSEFLVTQITTNSPLFAHGTLKLNEQPFLQRKAQDDSSDVLIDRVVVGTTAAVSTSVSVGYVVWMLRGGTLLTTFLSSMPAWQAFDPLPILESFENEDPDDDESLSSMISGA